MWDALFWLYLATATLLIVHEIDSAYWREWELFRLPGGPGGFEALHVPIVALVLVGIVLVWERSVWGAVLSLVVAVGGLAAFAIHMAFLRAGRHEFRAPVSIGMLIATSVCALATAALGVAALAS